MDLQLFRRSYKLFNPQFTQSSQNSKDHFSKILKSNSIENSPFQLKFIPRDVCTHFTSKFRRQGHIFFTDYQGLKNGEPSSLTFDRLETFGTLFIMGRCVCVCVGGGGGVERAGGGVEKREQSK